MLTGTVNKVSLVGRTSPGGIQLITHGEYFCLTAYIGTMRTKLVIARDPLDTHTESVGPVTANWTVDEWSVLDVWRKGGIDRSFPQCLELLQYSLVGYCARDLHSTSEKANMIGKRILGANAPGIKSQSGLKNIRGRMSLTN